MKLVIFDLDGTLLDTLTDIANSCNYSLAIHHFPIHPINEYKQLVGNGVKVLVQNALPAESRSEETIKMVLNDFIIHYEAHAKDNTKPYVGITEILKRLKHLGFRISIASNKYHEAVLDIAEYYFRDINFDLVLGHRTDFPPKPDPSIVFDTLKTLHITPASCFYIGDSAVDMQTAKNAQVMAIGVTWGFRTEKELLENGADYIIHHPNELLDILK